MSEFQLNTSGVVTCAPIQGRTQVPSAWFWSNLDAFTQGYIEAMFAEPWRPADDGTVLSLADGFGFSNLAPETLAKIIADCAAVQRTHGEPGTRELGASVWRARQSGASAAFPPLTPYLGDDGKVYLRERA